MNVIPLAYSALSGLCLVICGTAGTLVLSGGSTETAAAQRASERAVSATVAPFAAALSTGVSGEAERREYPGVDYLVAPAWERHALVRVALQAETWTGTGREGLDSVGGDRVALGPPGPWALAPTERGLSPREVPRR